MLGRECVRSAPLGTPRTASRIRGSGCRKRARLWPLNKYMHMHPYTARASWPLQDIVSLQNFIVGVHHLLRPPHLQSLPYCITIARPLRTIHPPTDSSFVCHTPYNNSDGNIGLSTPLNTYMHTVRARGVCKGFAPTWYCALTWYSSPTRPFAAPCRGGRSATRYRAAREPLPRVRTAF